MIKVLNAGIYCSVQDLGRLGMAKIGVPRAGAMDQFSAKMGNILLKNGQKDAVIEITFGQGRFEFTSDTFICITGGDFSPKVNTFPVKLNKVYPVKKDDFLSFGRRKYGARSYLCVQGGIQSEVILKSRSFYGGITKQRLLKGDELSIPKAKLYPEGFSKVKVFYEHYENNQLDCYPGAEYNLLTNKQKQGFQKLFTISGDNNRMGYRLEEAVQNDLPSILTSSVLPGTIQLTPSGKLIVLMRDAQVTGGYPRVLQLTDYAISRLSQKLTGEQIRFVLH